MVSTMTFPCHPVEKDETNCNKAKTYLPCKVHTTNPLGEQNSSSVHETQAIDKCKYCYLLTGEIHTSPPAFTRAQNAEHKCGVLCYSQRDCKCIPHLLNSKNYFKI